MILDIAKSKSFAQMMQQHLKDMIYYLLESNQNFGILCNLDFVEFDPPLPDSILNEFTDMTLFFLAGYTFESTRIENNSIIFEAGFGAENFGSVVTVDLLAIMQLLIDDMPALINMARPIKNDSVKQDDSGVQNSLNALLSNPENQKFLKK